MKPFPAAPLATAAIALLAALGPSPVRAEATLIMQPRINGVACTQFNQVECWADIYSLVPFGRLPNAVDSAFLGGDNAVQAAGQSNVVGAIFVTWLSSFGGGAFPSHFTQYGSMRASFLKVEEGSYTVGGGQAAFESIWVGYGFGYNHRPDGVPTSPWLEVKGGSVQATRVFVSYRGTNLPDGSGEIRLTGGTLQVQGSVTGPGRGAQPFTGGLLLDGGRLVTPAIVGMSRIVVGSQAGRRGYLDLNNGQTADGLQVLAGVDGGEGTILVAGTGARLTADTLTVGSGQGGRGVLAVGLSYLPGEVRALALTLGAGTGSSGQLQVSGAAAVLDVSGPLVIGAGGTAQLQVMNDGRVSAESMQVGNGGRLQLTRGSFLAASARFDPGSLLHLDIAGATAGTDFIELVTSTLDFAGSLELNFVGGFTPQSGQRIQLFGFRGFTGAFADAAITVTGFDKSALDFSRLGVDGSFGLAAAVPEPASWLAMLTGLVAIGRMKGRLRAATSAPADFLE